jgi:hypothetical protein
MGVLRRTTAACLAVLLPFMASCAGARHTTEEPTPASPSHGVSVEKGAVVLTGVALTDGPGSLLDTMRGKIPGFSLHRGPDICPEISLRGAVSFAGTVSPAVYVDGARATDTCVLESLRAADIERVEVYPMGFTTRPGYRSHGQGLILVFMRRGGAS